MHGMLKEFHGERVHIELPTLHEIVAAGRADPELLRMELPRAGIRPAGSFSAAGFDGQAPTRAAPQPGVIATPLGPPVISGTQFTVDLALNNPTRVVTPMIMDLTRERFFVDRVFTSAGGVTGGAVIYDIVEAAATYLYANRDVQRMAPGTEAPIITFSRRAPQAATVEKWGGKFYFTDEARDRNDVT